MNKEKSKLLLDGFFKEKMLTSHNIESFNDFIEKGIIRIVDEEREIYPDILPKGVNELKIKLGKIWIEKPSVREADGGRRQMAPIEARVRNLTYEAPVFLELTIVKDGLEEETETVHVGNFPIMVKSSHCYLDGKNYDELIEMGEDPNDPGGYFIINGTERVVIIVEDLAPNRVFVETKRPPFTHRAKVFSEDGKYRILHYVNRSKDGTLSINFTRAKEVPVFAIIKALGMFNDDEIVEALNVPEELMGDVYINLYEVSELDNMDSALDLIGRKMGITYSSRIRLERAEDTLDKYLFPHLGHDKKSRIIKAHYLLRMIRKLLLVSKGIIPEDDKDHYKNKRLRLCGNMMETLFRVAFRMFIGDMKYNFERLVKRGKLPGISSVTRARLFTSRVKSSLATGQWVGGREGVSQHMDRDNYLATLSHLRRVASLLTAYRENFEARDLHMSHWGKICSSETPDGPNVGLRKNLAVMCDVTTSSDETEESIVKKMKKLGLKVF
jgi:DNA-directed RNA polymerase subunit B